MNDKPDDEHDVTHLLGRWRAGDAEAAELLLARTYDELRRIARVYIRRERPGHTLQATALVNEVCSRLLPAGPRSADNREAFFRLLAGEMKRRLVDHARRRLALKRGGGAIEESIDGSFDVPAETTDDQESSRMLDRLDRALEQLATDHPRVAQIVELKFFMGMTNEKAAEALKLSPGTVKRDWSFGKAWLAAALEAES